MRNLFCNCFLAVAVTVTLCESESAAGLISNGSFEDDTYFVPDNQATMVLNNGSTTLPSWTVVTGEIHWTGPGNPYFINATDGDYWLDLTGYSDGLGPYGGVTQTIATQIGATYLLSFDIGTSSQYNSAGSAIFASAGNNGVIFSNVTNAINSWQTAVMQFQATSTSTTVTLQGWFASPANIGLDNVSVELVAGPNPVPEPSSLTLLGLGGLGLAFAARRRIAG